METKEAIQQNTERSETMLDQPGGLELFHNMTQNCVEIFLTHNGESIPDELRIKVYDRYVENVALMMHISVDEAREEARHLIGGAIKKYPVDRVAIRPFIDTQDLTEVIQAVSRVN